MAKITHELTLPIKVKLDVDKETAETCLLIVESFINANGVDLIVNKNEDGTVSLKYGSEKAEERACKTCYGYSMHPEDIDNPCWNCDDNLSGWSPK